jgi:FkbM family methyltransferase
MLALATHGCRRICGKRLIRVPLRGYAHPVYCRRGGSDPWVARQVFVLNEYECVPRANDVQYIIDCGANIGCASHYFLSHFPNARVLAVEPDRGNMRVCQQTLSPFGARASFVQAGVWSSEAPMIVTRGSFRDGNEWSFQVRPCADHETCDFRATTLPSLMKSAGFPYVDILKIDIEAAEYEVFSNGPLEWLEKVRYLVIELHDEPCERAVFNAVERFQPNVLRNGELTVFELPHNRKSAS